MQSKHEAIENLRQYLNTGKTWRDTGQMDKKTRAWLNRQVKAGKVLRWLDQNTFPLPKKAYHCPFGNKV